jgi:hypothetical protein
MSLPYGLSRGVAVRAACTAVLRRSYDGHGTSINLGILPLGLRMRRSGRLAGQARGVVMRTCSAQCNPVG